MNKILEIKNLSKDYGNFKLKDVNISLDRGYVMGFIGANGAGKSTTIKLIMNLIKKKSGEIKIFGKDNIANEKEVKEKIGFVYDTNCYYRELSIKDNVKIISKFYKGWNNDVFQGYMRKFNLDEKKKIKQLSKGMQMKFSIAVALSHGAELLIMDEPTSGLDPIVRNEILDILYEEIQDEKKSVFFSTHITTDLEKIADYITFIDNGEVVFSEEKDMVMEKYQKVKGDKDILDRKTREQFISIKENSFGFEGLTKKAAELKREFSDKIVVERASLEEIMLYSVGR